MQREQLKELYLKYKLKETDIFNIKFGQKTKPIITRSGIETIQNALQITVSYKLQKLSDDNKHAVVLGTGTIVKQSENGNPIVQTCESFGECAPYNNTNSYPVCMAEKRCLSRIVIKMSGLANYGVYGEDEADAFKRSNN